MAKSRLILDTGIDREGIEEGLEMPLSKSDQKKIVYTKYESTSSMVSDTKHTTEWKHQVTAHPRVSVAGGDEEGGVNIDDGVILSFEGEYAGVYAQNPDTKLYIAEEEVEDMEESTGRSFGRFARWDFYLVSAILTDGPERRERLAKAAEDKARDSETAMMSSMEKFFGKMLDRMGPQLSDPSQVKQLLENETIEALEPEQVQAMKELEEIESEDEMQMDAARLDAEKDAELVEG